MADLPHRSHAMDQIKQDMDSISSQLEALAVVDEQLAEEYDEFDSEREQYELPLQFKSTTRPPLTAHAKSAPSIVGHDGSRTPPRPSRSPALSDRTPPRSNARSASQLLSAPPMTRAHSSPICLSPQQYSLTYPRSSSPLRSPKPLRSPFRHSGSEETWFGSSLSSLSPGISSISEDAELKITPRRSASGTAIAPSTSSPMSHAGHSSYASLTFPRPLRRRPASPLRGLNNSYSSSVPASPHLSATTLYYSPAPLSASSSSASGKFSETFPSDLPYYSTSSTRPLSLSMPSTPTSARSRSPSISSLETIPDSPDAEVQAAEQDQRDQEERKKMWDLNPGSTSDRPVGSRSFGGRDKRKRWSVCGAEKRSDLNLETIWED